MHFLQAIISDISVLIVCNKTGGTIKGDIKKNTSEAGTLFQTLEIKIRILFLRLSSHPLIYLI